MADGPDTLLCIALGLREPVGNTPQGSIAVNDSGVARFISQVSIYSQLLGVALAQTTYATDANCEILAMRHLLGAAELEGVLVQAYALHAHRPFPLACPARHRLLDRGQTQPPQRVSVDP